MLIKYEYELLSYIVLSGISKRNGDLIISKKRIEEGLLEDIDTYFQILESQGIIQLEEDRLIVNSDEWIEFFLRKLKDNFASNSMDVICEKITEEKDNCKYFYLKISANGSEKVFKLILDRNEINSDSNKDLIYMCKPNMYENRIFWIELLNNVNSLNIFYSYLANEINNINRTIYRKIDILNALDDKYINQIFDNSIKNYFRKKKKKIVDFDIKQAKVIESFIISDDLSYYGVEFGDMMLWIIKNKKKILFLTLRNLELVYSKDIDNELNILQHKISKKVNEFYKLSLFKEYNILDNTLKVVGQASTLFVPISIIASILGILNINISFLQGYRYILYVIVFVLSIIQILIIYFVYVPSFKISKFNWNI